MEYGHLNGIAISIEKQGPSAVTKASFPLRYGKYSEIKTSDYEFRFNLNGEIKFIRGLHILEQIRQLKNFYGHNLENYHAIFLGNYDALKAGDELICTAASEVYKTLGASEKQNITPLLFLFGSVDSLLQSENRLFEKLNHLPF